MFAQARYTSMRGGGLLNAEVVALSAATAAVRSAAVKAPVVRQNSTQPVPHSLPTVIAAYQHRIPRRVAGDRPSRIRRTLRRREPAALIGAQR